MQQRIASFTFQTPPKLQVSVLVPPKILLPVSVFRPPQILLPVSELPVSVFRPPKIASFSFQNHPKYCCQFQNCQFQFLDPPNIASFSFQNPPQILLALSELPVSVFRPPQNIVASFSFQTPPQNLLKVMEQCLKTLQLIIFNFRGGVLKIFYRPPEFLKVMEQCSKTLPLIIFNNFNHYFTDTL